MRAQHDVNRFSDNWVRGKNLFYLANFSFVVAINMFALFKRIIQETINETVFNLFSRLLFEKELIEFSIILRE
jgi:hypothetical protein